MMMMPGRGSGLLLLVLEVQGFFFSIRLPLPQFLGPPPPS